MRSWWKKSFTLKGLTRERLRDVIVDFSLKNARRPSDAIVCQGVKLRTIRSPLFDYLWLRSNRETQRERERERERGREEGWPQLCKAGNRSGNLSQVSEIGPLSWNALASRFLVRTSRSRRFELPRCLSFSTEFLSTRQVFRDRGCVAGALDTKHVRNFPGETRLALSMSSVFKELSSTLKQGWQFGDIAASRRKGSLPGIIVAAGKRERERERERELGKLEISNVF